MIAFFPMLIQTMPFNLSTYPERHGSDGNPDHTNVTESKNKIYIILFAKLLCGIFYLSQSEICI